MLLQKEATMTISKELLDELLERIQDQKTSRIYDLMPWNFTAK